MSCDKKCDEANCDSTVEFHRSHAITAMTMMRGRQLLSQTRMVVRLLLVSGFVCRPSTLLLPTVNFIITNCQFYYYQLSVVND